MEDDKSKYKKITDRDNTLEKAANLHSNITEGAIKI